MLPKHSRHFLQPAAEKLNCDMQLVDDAVSFFYNEVRKALTEMRGPNIQIENLGSFKVKPDELPKLLYKYEHRLRALGPDRLTKVATRKDIQKSWQRVKNLKKMVDDERDRRSQFLAKKHGKPIENMAKQKSDSGRSKE